MSQHGKGSRAIELSAIISSRERESFHSESKAPELTMEGHISKNIWAAQIGLDVFWFGRGLGFFWFCGFGVCVCCLF